MRSAFVLALLLGAMIGALVVVTPSVVAQQPITVVSEEPRNEFPAGATFTISFYAPAGVKEARLRYQLAPDGTGASAVADCNSAATISCSFTLTSGRGIVIIPGAEVTYHWELTDGAGNKLATEDQTYVHQDTRFTFKTLHRDNITLYYHSGSESAAQAVLDAAAETLDKVSKLEQTQVTFPVKVFLYSTADEMQPAIAPDSPGRGVQVLGEVVYSDTAMVSADVATLDITRHEVAHIVTRQATKGPFGVPAWLNEGISVFSQSRPLEGHEAALQSAIRSDRVLSMRELTSSASGSVGETVGLYYGEAGSIVKYLVDTYGEEKFAELLKTFKEGSDVGKAFQSVYGFDQYGLENEWRKSVGLEPRAIVTVVPTATVEAGSPTVAATITSQASDARGGGNSSAVIIIVALIVLVIITAGAAIVVVRRRMSAVAG
jgi:hypothetical protein